MGSADMFRPSMGVRKELFPSTKPIRIISLICD